MRLENPPLRLPSRRGLALLLLGCAGCSGPSALGTARTLDAGAFDHVVGVDTGFVGTCTSDDSCAVGPIVGPSYALRYGVLGFLEPGLRLSIPEARLDLKAELLRSRYFDLALDPWVGGGPKIFSSTDDSQTVEARAGLHALVDFNLTEETSIVLSGGPAAAGRRLTSPEWTGEASVGLDLRWFRAVRFHPQVGVRGFPWQGVASVQSLTAGVGLGFGERPFFGSGPRPPPVPSKGERQPWPAE